MNWVNAGVLGIGVISTIGLSAWEVDRAKVRKDIYPLDPQEFQWVEGWEEPDQYFPRYFEPSGTIQILLRNDNVQACSARDIFWKGKPIDQATTRPDFAGEVIWYRMTPETVGPGETTQLSIRLRSLQALPAKIGVDGVATTLTVEDAEALRIVSVGFNAERDRLAVFVSGPEGAECESLSLDGIDTASAQVYNAKFANRNPAVWTLQLNAPLPYGKYIVVEAKAGKQSTFEQLRVRDDFFPVGIIGSNVNAYRKAGFNLLYHLDGGKVMKEIPGLACLSPVSDEEGQKGLAANRPGNAYFYGNGDEPDAHEPYGLPYMDRCGVNAMQEVLPLMSSQLRNDPVHLTAAMIDRTYAPLNWYVYGQLPDMPFNDCYVPTGWHGYDIETLSKTAGVLLSATAPRPVQMMLWTAANTNHTPRATTPLENEAQYIYTLASGLKGIHYFIDWSSFPQVSEDGYFIGAYEFPALWRSMARGNAIADRLAPLLNVAYPWEGAVVASTPKMWTGTLLADARHLVIGAVNRQIQVNALDKMRFSHASPVKDAEIVVTLPEGFEKVYVRQVAFDKVSTLPIKQDGKKLKIPVPELIGGTFYVVSTDPKIDSLLSGNAEVQTQVAATQKMPAANAGTPVAAKAWDDSTVTLPAGGLVLDFSDPATLAKAAAIITTNGALEMTEGGLLALRPGAADREAGAEVVFVVKTETEKVTAQLKGRTFNLGYFSALELGAASGRSQRPKVATTRIPLWESGRGEKEFLEVSAPSKDGKAVIRVFLRDPLIVRPDGLSCGVKTLRLTP